MKIPVEWAGDELFAEDQSKDEFIRNFMRESKQTRIVSEHDDKKSDRHGKDRKGKEKQAAARPERKDHRKVPEKREDKREDKSFKNRKNVSEIKPKTAAGKSSYEKDKVKKDLVSSAGKERPSKNLSLDKRMDYYKERYGEDFTVKREITAGSAKKSKKAPVKTDKKTPEKRSSFISKIKSIFKKK